MPSAKTVERKLLGRVILEGFVGPAEDVTDYCAVEAHDVSFDPDQDSDCAPFTSAQVRDEVGYISYDFRTVDEWNGGLTSGTDPQTGTRMVQWYTLTRVRVTIRTPSSQPEDVLDDHEARLRELLQGLDIRREDAPAMTIRQLAKRKPKVWETTDDGTWRERVIDFPFERRERIAHAGARTVELP